MGSPVLAWEDDDDNAVGLVADDHHAPSHSAVIASSPSPFQATRAEHSLSIFSAFMQKQSIPEEAETPLWSLIATLVPTLHPTDITADRHYDRSSVNVI
jgi:hypothetical protein